ncbi:MAG: TIGR03088 family PEP-CTERM/XrtA system glycosyltransferase [Magnetococcales bacterium]|nr:TIGR03088 family PEP-CTERM/XrtA system glycosyltransferase [Magnetococcales bacterium]
MLICHVLYRLDVGGMETVLAELIDRLPVGECRHAVVALTCCTDFKARIRRRDVTFHELHKRPGKDPGSWWRFWRLMRTLRPQVVHTLNIAALEMNLPAFLAGVPVRIHAEHGRDWHDLDGGNRRYRLMRRLLSPLIDCFVAVSRDLETWMVQDVGLPTAKVRLLVNGVDCNRFRPREPGFIPPWPGGEGELTIGTVGRFWPVKDHANLLRAFALLREFSPETAGRCRLILLGDGLLRRELEELAENLHLTERIWWGGWREDVATLLPHLDLFVLPSLAEGTPLTVLEAMACGLPVVATRVGGVADLMQEGRTGLLVPPGDAAALAKAMAGLLREDETRRKMGQAGREYVENTFSWASTVDGYWNLFREMVSMKGGIRSS